MVFIQIRSSQTTTSTNTTTTTTKGVGGHFMEATVFTTLEFVLGECVDLEFLRVPDDRTK